MIRATSHAASRAAAKLSGAGAPIERRHREAALLALPDVERRFPGEFFAEEREWIETGVPTPGLDFGNAISVAQALANLEAVTAHRAWNEGYDFAEHSFTDGHQANPYPATEPKPKPKP